MAIDEVHSLLPSNRKFGGLFTLICTVGAMYLYYRGSAAWPVPAVLALLFVGTSVVAPALLLPLNRVWFRLGLLLGRIVSPVVLAGIFFLLITPIALVARLRGRDVLLLKKRAVPTYWVVRDPPGPEPQSFKNQF